MESSDGKITLLRRGTLNERMELRPEVVILATITPLLMVPFLIVFSHQTWAWVGILIGVVGFVTPIYRWYRDHPEFQIVVSEGICEIIRLGGANRGQTTALPAVNYDAVVIRFSLEQAREVTGSREVAFYDTRLKHVSDPGQDVALEQFYDRKRSERLAESVARLLAKPVRFERTMERSSDTSNVGATIPIFGWTRDSVTGFALLILGIKILSVAFVHLDEALRILKTGSTDHLWVHLLWVAAGLAVGGGVGSAGYRMVQAGKQNSLPDAPAGSRTPRGK